MIGHFEGTLTLQEILVRLSQVSKNQIQEQIARDSKRLIGAAMMKHLQKWMDILHLWRHPELTKPDLLHMHVFCFFFVIGLFNFAKWLMNFYVRAIQIAHDQELCAFNKNKGILK